MRQRLSSKALKTLDALGITVHGIRRGHVVMADDAGPYDNPRPTLEAVELACSAVEDESRFPDQAARFAAFHNALAITDGVRR